MLNKCFPRSYSLCTWNIFLFKFESTVWLYIAFENIMHFLKMLIWTVGNKIHYKSKGIPSYIFFWIIDKHCDFYAFWLLFTTCKHEIKDNSYFYEFLTSVWLAYFICLIVVFIRHSNILKDDNHEIIHFMCEETFGNFKVELCIQVY